jgi:hypothetical protein
MILAGYAIIERTDQRICRGNARVGTVAVFGKKNSEKQRQNSGRPAVISIVQAAKTQDFR